MASNHIGISGATQIGSDARTAIDAVRHARESVAKLYGIMAEFSDDTAALAAELGVSAADAVTVRSNFLNAQTVLNGADISYLINRLGQ